LYVQAKLLADAGTFFSFLSACPVSGPARNYPMKLALSKHANSFR